MWAGGSAHAPARRAVVRGWGLAALLGVFWVVAVLLSGTSVAAEPAPVIQLEHTQAVLRATYAKGKNVALPRLLLLDADGRALLVETGMRGGVGRRLAKTLAAGKPLDTLLDLAAVLAETRTIAGLPVKSGDVPAADGYVVDYWAEWCVPCRELDRDLGRQLKRWSKQGKDVVWIKIESDPTKLPEHADD